MDRLFNKQDVSQRNGPDEKYSRMERSRSRSHERSYSRSKEDHRGHHHSHHHRSRHHGKDYDREYRPRTESYESRSNFQLESGDEWKTLYGQEDRNFGQIDGYRSGIGSERSSRPSEPKQSSINQDELDSRTVFVWQLSHRIQPCDLYEFFSIVGKVRDIRLIISNKTQKSKGIAYVEFSDKRAADRAISLTGTKVLGVPIHIQASQTGRSLSMGGSGSSDVAPPRAPVPMKLYVGSLHYNVSQDMVRSIFEPFGRIAELKLIKDGTTGRSQGFGFVTFYRSEDAKRAMEQLSGSEVAGRAIKVNTVVEGAAANWGGRCLDSDDAERSGVDLGPTGRLALMAKLAEGTGLQVPKPALAQLRAAQQQRSTSVLPGNAPIPAPSLGAGALPSPCFLLTNMFDSVDMAKHPEMNKEVREDVMQECSKFGQVLHMYIDGRSSRGRIYVKCANTSVATQCVARMHGRYFSGRVISATFVPLQSHHELFPESVGFKPAGVPPPQ